MWTRCVHLCLSTCEWSISWCVQLNSYRFIECVGGHIQILHIHIILKHNVHILVLTCGCVHTMCTSVFVYFRMEYLSVCPTKFISLYRLCRLAHVLECVHECLCTHACTHEYMYMSFRMYMHVYIYVYVHIQVCIRVYI